MSVWGTALDQLLLHAIAVLFEAFIIAASITGRVQEIKAFENIVRQWVATGCFSQRCSWPGLTSLQPAVQFSQAGNELCLLLFEHLNITFGINFVLGLFPFAKYTNGIVCLASAAWTGTITFGLLEATSIAGFAYPLPDVIL